MVCYNGNRHTYIMYTHQVKHTCIECPHVDVAMHFEVLLKSVPDTCHIELVVNLYCTRHAAGMTGMKHDLQIATKLQDVLLARPARSMVSRQQQHYKTCCWHNPHEAWSPDSNNITRHAAGTTRTKHDLQTATKLQDIRTAGTTCTNHGLQTATTLQDMLLVQPTQIMVSRQQ